MADFPAIAVPPPTADVECFEEALRKSLLATMMRPEAVAALKEGLTAADLRERRMWWELLLEFTVGKATSGEEDAAKGPQIHFHSHVPAPAHEEGPVEKSVAILPEKIAESRR